MKNSLVGTGVRAVGAGVRVREWEIANVEIEARVLFLSIVVFGATPISLSLLASKKL